MVVVVEVVQGGIKRTVKIQNLIQVVNRERMAKFR